jgi:hypothetical protein
LHQVTHGLWALSIPLVPPHLALHLMLHVVRVALHLLWIEVTRIH